MMAWAADAAVERLAQPPVRQQLLAQVFGPHQQQVEVAFELEMLEAVVEQEDGGAEPPLGEHAGQMPIGADQHRHARAACAPAAAARRRTAPPARSTSAAVAHHEHAVHRLAARVAAAQDRRPLAGGEQQPGQRGHGRRLAAAAHREVADADDRLREPAADAAARACVPRPPGPRHLAVCGAEELQCTTRNGRTTAERGCVGRQHARRWRPWSCPWRRGWPRPARAPRRRAAPAAPGRPSGSAACPRARARSAP